MPEYLIDYHAMATVWVTASSEEAAIKEVKGLTHGLDLCLQVGYQTQVRLVDVTCRDDDPEIIDVQGDDLENLEDDSDE
jgi:RES domain-containing protein